MTFKEMLEPVSDTYFDENNVYRTKPPVRGVIVSFVVAMLVWALCACVSGLVFFSVAQLYVHLCNGEWMTFPHKGDKFVTTFGFAFAALMFEGLMRMTPILCYQACRICPSLLQAVVIGMFKPRYHGGGKYSLAPPYRS